MPDRPDPSVAFPSGGRDAYRNPLVSEEPTARVEKSFAKSDIIDIILHGAVTRQRP